MKLEKTQFHKDVKWYRNAWGIGALLFGGASAYTIMGGMLWGYALLWPTVCLTMLSAVSGAIGLVKDIMFNSKKAKQFVSGESLEHEEEPLSQAEQDAINKENKKIFEEFQGLIKKPEIKEDNKKSIKNFFNKGKEL